jgi:tetratricopeptide (TPR) repeat protein
MGNDQHQASKLIREGMQAVKSGDHPGALERYQRALEIHQKSDDLTGQAQVLHQMALSVSETDNEEQAMELFRRSLAFKEQVGDLPGEANTLANMAFVAFKAKDYQEAAQLNQQAITLLERIEAWSDMVMVLNNHAFLDQSAICSAKSQAFWLALRVPLDPEIWLNRCAELVNELGLESAAGQLVAAAAPLLLVRNSGKEGPDQQQWSKALLLLAACAEARDVPPKALNEWLEREHLQDANYVLLALNAALEEMIAPGEWLFNPSGVPEPWWRGESNRQQG